MTLTGPVGVGKTAVAAAAAWNRRQRHPDGAGWVDLTSVTVDDGVPVAVASALGVQMAGADPVDAVVRALSPRTVLLVLDNCEQVVPGVAALVSRVAARCPGVTVLATSREPLDLDLEAVHRLAPLEVAPGDRPDAAALPAVRLFVERWRRGTGPGAGADPDPAAVVDICRICASVGGLPLGIELAARRARAFSLSEIADSVADDPRGLTRDARSDRRDRTLADAVDASHRLCGDAEQVVHRRIAVLAGPFTLAAAQAVAGTPPLSPGGVMDALGGLVHRSMLSVDHTDADPTSTERTSTGRTRFRQLVPVRADATERLRAAGDEAAALDRRDRWVSRLVATGPRRGRPGQREHYEALDRDAATVAAAADSMFAAPAGDRGALLASRMVGYWYDRNRSVEGRRRLAAAVAHPGCSPFPAAAAAAALGAVLSIARRPGDARPHLERSVPVLAAVTGERAAEAAGLLVDVASAGWVGDDWAYAARVAGVALDRCVAAGADYEALIAEAVLAAAALFAGPPERALDRAEQLLRRDGIRENGQALLFVCATAGIAALFLHDVEAGLHWTAEALRQSDAIGALNTGGVLEQRAAHLSAAGRPADAVRCLAASATRARRTGAPWPGHPGTAELLDGARRRLSDVSFAAAWAAGERIVSAADGIRVEDWL
ncbi:ATP-binding protein [Nakamurella endophytica]|uniref:ATPase n=1 Tax=Nakamurella endophytica TaxID=1748367 RepID=A0A917WLU6_9ACTN|nr:hypothetical protein [Nakamurella endophytica]GGM13809.1 hypothetical protein GCM10011594_37130 [Nakamurella endophytica]